MIIKNIKVRLYTSSILLFFLLLMIKSNFIATYFIILFSVLSIIEYFEISKKIFSRSYLKYISNIFFITYLSAFCFIFFYFLNFLQFKIILYVLILGCIASDIGGYLFGNIFKGPKLTKISPNKTYAGAIGSILCTSLTVILIIFLLTNNFSNLFVIMSIFTSLGCQAGDLFFSFLKRKAKIKDTGKILPGHGGILDRVDGVLLGVPIGLLSLILIN
jgi:phosphatidate cytidylyltransferase